PRTSQPRAAEHGRPTLLAITHSDGKPRTAGNSDQSINGSCQFIDGLDRVTDQRKLIRLRGRIHAAARVAAEGCHTTYHATDSALTIGIQAPDAKERINQLRNALSKLITKHGWTTRDEPR
ncbi:hypothetical protein ABGB18_46100, partial [Nonomuraea sp. B12E4]|uniref:hypothetical protein n=1 Tax=Nonomuraea sp. B12E4 TaxID=3153564 RepID=UPI00325EACD9